MYRTKLPCQTECEQASDLNMAQTHADRMLFSVLFGQALQLHSLCTRVCRKDDMGLLCISSLAIFFQYLTCLALQVAIACAMYDMSVQSVWSV